MGLCRRIVEFRYWLACRISPWVSDVDYRFACVLDHTTGVMSKTNYSLETMYGAIDQRFIDEREEAFQEGVEHGRLLERGELDDN